MEGDDASFAAAKLRDYIRGDVRENDDLYAHTGLVEPESEANALLSFMESVYDATDGELPPEFKDSRAGRVLRRTAATEHVGGAVGDLPSFAVGLTESEVDISAARAFAKMQASLLNERAPYSGVIFGGMNRGKTSFALLLIEVWRELVDAKYGTELEPVLVTNAASIEAADYVAQSRHELRDLVFGSEDFLESDGDRGRPPEIEAERPTFWLFDECSTHLDARTHSREVAEYYTPLVKRFAKVNVDAAHLGHSGMDIHAELRRHTITTEFIFKTALQTAEVYAKMDEDEGADHKYTLEEIPDTTVGYDPDDFAPFSWD